MKTEEEIARKVTLSLREMVRLIDTYMLIRNNRELDGEASELIEKIKLLYSEIRRVRNLICESLNGRDSSEYSH